MQPVLKIVADHVAAAVRALEVEVAFGLVGSGNFFLTHAMARAGIRFVTTRHECAAVAAADGYGRVTGRIGVASVHTGPGLANAMLGLGEAVKAGTALVLFAADVPAAARGSNSRIDQHDLVESVGAIAERVFSPGSAAADVARAFRRARLELRPVVVMLPTDIQESPAPAATTAPPRLPLPDRPVPGPEAVARMADLIAASRRPVIVAGRGAVLSEARTALAALGERIGALMATSAMGNGFFAEEPWNIGISGGFSTPFAAQRIAEADLILGFGATLNQWTTRNGGLLGEGARVVQVDLAADIRTAFRPADLLVTGDAAAAARLVEAELARRGFAAAGFRTPTLRDALERRRFWNLEPFGPGAAGRIDPRALSDRLDRLLPANRALAVDGGHFLGYPPMYIRVPEARAFVFPNAFMPIGLGLGAAIGAAMADPGRPTVAAVGDGGAMMTLGELDTIIRHRLPVLVVVYNDASAGAEAHHYGPLGYDLDLVSFADVDFATVARGLGIEALTVRHPDDLAPVEAWARRLDGPLLIDAKIDGTVRAGWLEEAFRNSDHPIRHEENG